jgi:maltose O-acetyltransferase
MSEQAMSGFHHPFRELKRRFTGWIARELAQQGLRHGAETALLAPTAVIAPEAQIQNFFGNKASIQVGDHSYVRGRLITYGHGGAIHVGAWCYVGVRSEIWSMNSVTIGDRVLIAHDVNIHDGTGHSLDARERHDHFRRILEQGHPTRLSDVPGITSSPVIIEDDVWISFGVTILKGVRIGARSVIAAGSIVAHDVPPDVLYRNEIMPKMEPLGQREGA